jgi:hypothetical protein
MSASTSTASTKQQLRTVARAQRRHMATEKKRQAARQRAEQQEQRDEAVAPCAQRLPVLGRDGIVFVRSNPVKRMVARGQGKDRPLLSKRHADAADRLLRIWEEGASVTAGVAHYGVRLSGTSTSGEIADGVLRGINRQIAARAEIEGIKTRLGASSLSELSCQVANLAMPEWRAW